MRNARALRDFVAKSQKLSGSNFIFSFLSRYLEILTKSRVACSDRQAKESAVKCLSQGQNNVSSFRTATVSIAFAINQSVFTQLVTLLTFYYEYEITAGVGKFFQTRAVFNTLKSSGAAKINKNVIR